MFVGRKPDNTIYGMWTTKQQNDDYHIGIEELPDNHPDVLAFQNRPQVVVIDPRDIKIADLEARLVSLENKEVVR